MNKFLKRHRPQFLPGLVLVAWVCFGSNIAWAGNLFSGPVNSPAGAFPGALAAGDFNGDSKLDLAVANDRGKTNGKRNQVKILLGNGNGTFQKPAGYKVGTMPDSVVTADFNKDGKPDLAVVNAEGPGIRRGWVSVLLGNGDGSFQQQVRYKAGIGPLKATVADFNRDGNLDLAVTTGTAREARVDVLLGNGDGTFKPAIEVPTGHRPFYIASGDLNGDGKPDLVVATACCPGERKLRTTALLGNGDGTFRIAWSVGYQVETFGIALGDFNGDGKLDLAQTYRRRITIRLGNGDGTFGDGSRDKLDFGGPLVIADFNGDGIVDIAIAEIGLDNVEVLLGNGDGTFAVESIYPLSTGAQAMGIVAADLNNDGKPDLAVTDQFNHVVSVLLNTGAK